MKYMTIPNLNKLSQNIKFYTNIVTGRERHISFSEGIFPIEKKRLDILFANCDMHASDGYEGKNVQTNYHTLFEKSTDTLFLTGTNLADIAREKEEPPMILSLTQKDGADFVEKLNKAYNDMKNREDYKASKFSKEVNSIILLDILVPVLINPIEYLKGMEEASKKYSKDYEIFIYA